MNPFNQFLFLIVVISINQSSANLFYPFSSREYDIIDYIPKIDKEIYNNYYLTVKDKSNDEWEIFYIGYGIENSEDKSNSTDGILDHYLEIVAMIKFKEIYGVDIYYNNLKHQILVNLFKNPDKFELGFIKLESNLTYFNSKLFRAYESTNFQIPFYDKSKDSDVWEEFLDKYSSNLRSLALSIVEKKHKYSTDKIQTVNQDQLESHPKFIHFFNQENELKFLFENSKETCGIIPSSFFSYVYLKTLY